MRKSSFRELVQGPIPTFINTNAFLVHQDLNTLYWKIQTQAPPCWKLPYFDTRTLHYRILGKPMDKASLNFNPVVLQAIGQSAHPLNLSQKPQRPIVAPRQAEKRHQPPGARLYADEAPQQIEYQSVTDSAALLSARITITTTERSLAYLFNNPTPILPSARTLSSDNEPVIT